MEERIQFNRLVIDTKRMKLCGTVLCEDEQEILSEISELLQKGAEIIEWRADGWLSKRIATWRKEDVLVEEVIRLLNKIRKEKPEVPMIFTLRTMEQGGFYSGSRELYEEVLMTVAESRQADIIDVEIQEEEEYKSQKLIDYICEKQGYSLVSAHVTEPFFSVDRCERIINALATLNGTISKLAVYVNSEEEMLKLVEIAKSKKCFLDKPHILIAMGEAGARTRYDWSLTGSCITYGCVSTPVAPGQLSVEELKKMCYTFTE